MTGRDEDAAARGEGDLAAVLGKMGRGQVVKRLGDDVLARLIEIGVERDRHDLILPIGDVKKMNIGAELVGDAAAVQRGAGGVPAGVVRVLFEIAAVGFHRPEVHCAVAVAEEINAALPRHRRLACARIVGGERDCFGVAVGIFPEVLRSAAFVAFGMAALKRQAREEERLARIVVNAVGRLVERHRPAFRGDFLFVEVEHDEPRLGQSRIGVRAGEDLAVRRPADERDRGPVERAPPRRAAGERHGVDLSGAVVMTDEG